ncbi:predicted protein [Coccidioides posadasii str. Silveira]|uniref:Predicted protein n=1 Tax=Coccidioides posadasii (strain RMSCC 757 / Silveira) TaxID=443226 RepID=E9D6J8_COCPS|nr:predicted protein [Coccidioides posadasii str. Silveira]
MTPPASNQLNNGESSDNTNRTTIFSIVIRNVGVAARLHGHLPGGFASEDAAGEMDSQ